MTTIPVHLWLMLHFLYLVYIIFYFCLIEPVAELGYFKVCWSWPEFINFNLSNNSNEILRIRVCDLCIYVLSIQIQIMRIWSYCKGIMRSPWWTIPSKFIFVSIKPILCCYHIRPRLSLKITRFITMYLHDIFFKFVLTSFITLAGCLH